MSIQGEIDTADKRELELNAREMALNEREKELNNRESMSKIFVISYVECQDKEMTHHFIGCFKNKSTAINSVIPWLVKNELGGFDADTQCDIIEETTDECPSNEEDVINYHMRNQCKTFKELFKVLGKYGDSYFRNDDEDGTWNIYYKNIDLR